MKLSRLLALLVIGFSSTAFAQCAAFPCVVASVSLTNQSQNIPATEIFTPSATGVYRISGYLSTSDGTNKRATWSVDVAWTDNRGSKKVPFAAAIPNAYYDCCAIQVQAVAGQPLLYQTFVIGGGQGSGGMTYDLFLTVEQLQ